MHRFRSVVLATVALGLAPGAVADQITITSDRDNSIFAEESGYSNGAGQAIFAGQTGLNNGGNVRRGLVRFDLSGIPAGSTIDDVTLTLYVTNVPAGGGADDTFDLHRVLSDWGESTSDSFGGTGVPAETGDATWTHTFFATTLWGAAGGDYAATASATDNVSTTGDWSSATMIADVQGWLDAPATNFGWIIRGNETLLQTARGFGSRENLTPGFRPELVVDFTPPAMTGACCLPGGACADLEEADCLTMSGAFEGAGTACATTTCTGACCLPGAVCQVEIEVDCDALGGDFQGTGTTCTPNPCPLNLTPFLDPLPIPAVAQPTSGTAGGAATYTISMRQVQQQLHAQMPNPTTVWGYGDKPLGATFPGPTIEAFSGVPITVDFVNDLRSSYPAGPYLTTHHLAVDLCAHGADDGPPKAIVHLHGGHVPADVDGYPEDHYPPGDSLIYTYPNNQQASTIWYHDHSLGKTRLNVYMGLAGFYLIRDAFENDPSTDLPSGAYEIPIAIQDRAFNQDASLDYPEEIASMFFGDHMLANGKIWPFLDVDRGKYRLRLLNGCGSRTMTLSFVDQTTMTPLPFDMIAAEGGFFAAPVPLTEVTLAPAERADVVIDFRSLAAGTEVILTNTGPGPPLPNVMKFVVGASFGYTANLEDTWPAVEVLDEADAVQFRDFDLARGEAMHGGGDCPDPWLINDLHWDDVTEFPELGDTEVWSWINRSGMMHPMHLHLVFFQVLDRQPFMLVDDEVVTTGPRVTPPPEEQGWKDTVRAEPFEITRVIARFEDYEGLFAYHCHILEHEDHEMMRQFRTIQPCDADTDRNGMVDIDDVVNVILDFGGVGDANGDGFNGDIDGIPGVDIDDVVLAILEFGPCF